jgi:hypothetical protein
MDPRLLALPFLIGSCAVLMLMATWGASVLARRIARWDAGRPHFTSEERERLRALREQYRRGPDDR